MAVALDDQFGSLEAVFTTDAFARQMAGLEFSLGEGPAHEASATNRPCVAEDLDSALERGRWPLFTAQASAAGAGAVHAFPLSPFGNALGAVSLYSRRPGALTPPQHQDALAVADLIGLSLIAPDADEVIGLGLRMTVHQAAGMVMQQTGMSIADALVLLKATAFSESQLVDELAAAVVAGARRFEKMEPDDGKA